MKRIDLPRHLESHGCELLREGGNHTVYANRRLRKTTSIPRHREIDDFLARKICRDLQVAEPGSTHGGMRVREAAPLAADERGTT